MCLMNTQMDVLGALKDALSCREEKREGDVSLHNRMKVSTRKMLERGKRFVLPDDLIEELDDLVRGEHGKRSI